jgi:hypothetical protein
MQQDISRRMHILLRPSGAGPDSGATHGLRRGLHSSAALRLGSCRLLRSCRLQCPHFAQASLIPGREARTHSDFHDGMNAKAVTDVTTAKVRAQIGNRTSNAHTQAPGREIIPSSEGAKEMQPTAQAVGCSSERWSKPRKERKSTAHRASHGWWPEIMASPGEA